MKPKPYPLIVLLLALVVFGLKPGPVVATEPTAHESGAQTCVMIQRSTFGEVADGYIWSTEPEISYNYSVLNVGYLEGGEKRSFVRFGLDFLPPGAVVQSALFGIWENTPGSGETVGIYRITEPWTEGEPTWSNFADSYDDAVEWGSFVAGGSGFVVGDVTALASAWVEGEVPNYGLMLLKSSGQMLDSYASSEAGSTGPWLALCYEVNNDPEAEDDSATTDEDTPVTIDVLDNDFDPDGDPLTLDDYDASSTQGGTVSCTVAGECTYTPAGDFNGSDTFGYTAGDGRGGAGSATVTVIVNPVNDPPVAVDDSATTGEDSAVQIDVLDNDSDPDGDTLSVSDYDATSAAGGAVSCTVAGECTYTPPGAYSVTDTFDYTADDGHGGSDTATVEVVVGDGGPIRYLTYLPLVLYNYPEAPLPPAPDLVVTSVTLTGGDVQVVIENQGDMPVPPTIGFWVDLYVAPSPVPTGVNQTWQSCAAEGIVWGVPKADLPLEPGGEMTLRPGDEYYWPTLSKFSGTLPSGTPIYVQVDSANGLTTYGAVLENHEIAGAFYNNVSGPILPALFGLDGAPSVVERSAAQDRPSPASLGLPPRP